MDHDALVERISGTEHRIDGLERWQKQQNGSIHRVEQTVTEMDKKFDRKFDTLHYWILGVMATTILTLVTVLLTSAKG